MEVGPSEDETFDDGRRALRKPVQLDARIRNRGSPFRLSIVDLSASGFRGETVNNLPIGSQVIITLPGLAPINATVKWRDAAFVGCAFEKPLHPAVFDHIVASSG